MRSGMRPGMRPGPAKGPPPGPPPIPLPPRPLPPRPLPPRAKGPTLQSSDIARLWAHNFQLKKELGSGFTKPRGARCQQDTLNLAERASAVRCRARGVERLPRSRGPGPPRQGPRAGPWYNGSARMPTPAAAHGRQAVPLLNITLNPKLRSCGGRFLVDHTEMSPTRWIVTYILESQRDIFFGFSLIIAWLPKSKLKKSLLTSWKDNQKHNYFIRQVFTFFFLRGFSQVGKALGVSSGEGLTLSPPPHPLPPPPSLTSFQTFNQPHPFQLFSL